MAELELARSVALAHGAAPARSPGGAARGKACKPAVLARGEAPARSPVTLARGRARARLGGCGGVCPLLPATEE
jgi:hypothetical protein